VRGDINLVQIIKLGSPAKFTNVWGSLSGKLESAVCNVRFAAPQGAECAWQTRNVSFDVR